jgi:hypothetical protein
MKRVFSTLLIAAAFCFASSKLSAQQQITQAVEFSNTLEGKIAIAVISALLSLLVGYVLYYLKDRKEARRRISYDIDFKKGMLGIEERLAKDLQIRYKGRPAENISYVRCPIDNSGTAVVRKQQLRFEFSAGAEILDWSADPKPPKEFGFSAGAGGADDKNEKTVLFAYFPVDQLVTLHFILSGGAAQDVKVFGFNEDEDVQVVPGNIGIAIDDRRQIERFIVLYLITLFAPRAFSGIPFFGNLASSAYYVIAVIIALRFIPTVARVVAAILTSVTSSRQPTVAISNVYDSTLTVGAGGAQVTHQVRAPDHIVETEPVKTISQ